MSAQSEVGDGTNNIEADEFVKFTDRTVVPLHANGDELQALRVENAQLRTALKSRIVIEQAKGAISARLATTPEVAFEMLRGLARSQRRNLTEYAIEVVANHGRLDGAPNLVEQQPDTQTKRASAQATDEAPVADTRPRLLFFTSSTSGPCRNAESWIAQVLQHRRNHRKVKLVSVDVASSPELKERFRVERLPTLVLVEDQTAKARLECPRGSKDITAMLAPWLV
jgi:thiol-disulfide isomerase/thioredoxin